MTPDSTITVSTEASLHKALRGVLQELATTHGVRVTDVRVEWYVARSIGESEPQATIRGIQIISESL